MGPALGLRTRPRSTRVNSRLATAGPERDRDAAALRGAVGGCRDRPGGVGVLRAPGNRPAPLASRLRFVRERRGSWGGAFVAGCEVFEGGVGVG